VPGTAVLSHDLCVCVYVCAHLSKHTEIETLGKRYAPPTPSSYPPLPLAQRSQGTHIPTHVRVCCCRWHRLSKLTWMHQVNHCIVSFFDFLRLTPKGMKVRCACWSNTACLFKTTSQCYWLGFFVLRRAPSALELTFRLGAQIFRQLCICSPLSAVYKTFRLGT